MSYYFGSDSTCPMYIWFPKVDNIYYSACIPKQHEYKDKNLGYRVNSEITEPSKYPFLGIQECMDYNIHDDWCKDCNDDSGQYLSVRDFQ